MRGKDTKGGAEVWTLRCLLHLLDIPLFLERGFRPNC